MSNNISVNFIIEGAKPKKNGTYPIKLNLYGNTVGQKRYGVKLSATKEQWQKLDSPKLRDNDLKELKLKLEGIRQTAQEVIDGLPVFSFVAFEETYFGKATQAASIYLKDWFNDYINELKENGQIGSALSYQTTFNSFDNFRKGLTIYDITPCFLKSYEKHLLNQERSISTVGIYMRQLRSVINKAIKAKALSADNYPFREYTVPAGRNVKKALEDIEIKKILDFVPENALQQKALNFWIFSYLCNGINFADIVHLKKENYHKSYLTFIREKTKRTRKKDLTPIKVALNNRAISIIEKYKNTETENPYLFSVLDVDTNAVTARHRNKRLLKFVNKQMGEIANILGIKSKVSTYAARHSYSTVLMRKGAPVSFIKESLGHSSVLVTENYLASFADETKLQYANLLTEL